jgi:hypothetical protein
MNKTLHVFLLAGQSNMAGRGDSAEVEPISDPEIRMFRDGRWQPAVEPLHHTKPERDAIGLGMSFAAEVRRLHPDWTVGLLPCAVGGTRLCRWEKGADLHKNAVAMTREALVAGTLAGILWHQGEGDGHEAAEAESYGERLPRMITDLRAALGAPSAPFVFGELGRFMAGHPNFPHIDPVLAAIQTIPARVPRCALVSSEGLEHRGDHLHFNAKALREFGLRYARAWAALS